MKIKSLKVVVLSLLLASIAGAFTVDSVTATNGTPLPLPQGTTPVSYGGGRYIYVIPNTAWWPIHYCILGVKCVDDHTYVICRHGIRVPGGKVSMCARNSYDTYISGTFKFPNIKIFSIKVIPTSDSLGVGILEANCGGKIQKSYTPILADQPLNILTPYTMIRNGKNCTTWKLTTGWKVHIKAVSVQYAP